MAALTLCHIHTVSALCKPGTAQWRMRSWSSKLASIHQPCSSSVLAHMHGYERQTSIGTGSWQCLPGLFPRCSRPYTCTCFVKVCTGILHYMRVYTLRSQHQQYNGRQVALSLLRLPIEECLYNQIACHSQDNDNTAYCLSHILDLLI